MNNIDCAAIGAVVMDTLVSLDEFPKTDTKMCAKSTKACGGGPAGTGIVAASKLGVSCAFLSSMADDAGGRWLRSDFEKYGVDTSFSQTVSGCRSFTSQIWLDLSNATRTIVFDKGDLPPTVLNDEQKSVIRRAKILMTDGNDLDAAVEAAGIIRSAGGRVLYDAGGRYENVSRLLELTDILIPSKEFALGVTGETNPESAARALYEQYHPEVVVITCGKDGGVIYDGKLLQSYPIYPADVVDSNGAGDVFHGAFAAAVICGASYIKACHFGSATSAIKCMGMGARESVPDKQTVIKYLRSNGYEF